MNLPDSFFLPAAHGSRFCVFHAPPHTARGAIIHVAPLFEEASKSRRLAALQSRAFAARGYAVLQMDLYGCGDSSGEFADASWTQWQDDLRLACDWLQQRTSAPLWWWGIRAGCLLARDVAASLPIPANFLWWQPVSDGQRYLQQFLRLQRVGAAFGKTPPAAETGDERLTQSTAPADTAPLELAGYEISPALMQALEHARLTPVAPATPSAAPRLVWLEVTGRADAPLPPAAQHSLAAWQAAGYVTHSCAVHSAPFWQTTEITEAPELIESSLQLLELP